LCFAGVQVKGHWKSANGSDRKQFVRTQLPLSFTDRNGSESRRSGVVSTARLSNDSTVRRLCLGRM